MPQYSVITREDEQSILLKNKIIHFLSEYNYTYNEETPETVFVVGGDGTFLKAIHQYVDKLKNMTFIGIH
ncbi:MAG: NAD kinase, partial [Erysipelotrichaceae bacterium]|nr:NAD kinase [Erysipelotrichaceae bacterium]